MAESIGDIASRIPNVNVSSLPKSEVQKSVNVNVVQVRQIAHKLSVQLNDSDSFEFFCKVARRLPEHLIWSKLETALNKDHPAPWFSKTCSILMDESHA